MFGKAWCLFCEFTVILWWKCWPVGSGRLNVKKAFNERERVSKQNVEAEFKRSFVNVWMNMHDYGESLCESQHCLREIEDPQYELCSPKRQPLLQRPGEHRFFWLRQLDVAADGGNSWNIPFLVWSFHQRIPHRSPQGQECQSALQKLFLIFVYQRLQQYHRSAVTVFDRG